MRLLLAVLATVVCLGFCSSLKAAIVFETEVEAQFDVLFYADGPLGDAVAAEGFPTDVPIPAKARGFMRFEIEDITSSTTEADILGAVSLGRLIGFDPGPFFSISPNVEFIGGTLTNIVQTNGAVTSATVNNLEMIWDMELTLPSASARVVSESGLGFSGDVTGIPYLDGDTLVGPDGESVDGLLDLGNGEFDANPAIAVSNRRMIAVPEPSAGILLLASFGSAILYRRRG